MTSDQLKRGNSWISSVKKLGRNFTSKDFDKEFGLPVPRKKNGVQKGYPSQPCFMPIWQYLSERYNMQRGRGDVIFYSNIEGK